MSPRIYSAALALAVTVASRHSAAQSSAPSPSREPSWDGPRLALRVGLAARPLIGVSLIGVHTIADGSWLPIELAPAVQVSERFAVELGINVMMPLLDPWQFATFRLALTPAAAWDWGVLYLRAGVPIMVSDAVRTGLQLAVGVTVARRFYVGITGDALVPDLLAGVGLELGVRFDPWRLRAVDRGR